MGETERGGATAAERAITARIADLPGWRGACLARIRALVLAAAPGIVEDWKWDTPVWTSGGNVVSFGAFKDHVKVNFFQGASLPDPQGLFNAGLDAKASRSIDLRDGDALDEAAFLDLVRAAVTHRVGGPKS